MQTPKAQPRTKEQMIGLSLMTVVFSALFFLSFETRSWNEGFLEQLGISRADAEAKITNSILGGYLDQYGVKNAKNIALGNRTAVTLDLLRYTKSYVSDPAFLQAYAEMRAGHRPQPNEIQSPDDMQAEMVARLRESVAQNEAALKKADASLKPIFEEVLAGTRKMLQEAEDPNNPQMAMYRSNYEQMLDISRQPY